MTSKLKLALLVAAFLIGTIGVAAAQDGRYYDHDGDDYSRYDRDDFRRGMQVARSIGFEDGEQVAREDMWHGKPFNPYPRGHNHADRGYARDFGSISDYRANYTDSYRDGYTRTFQRSGYYR